MTTQEKRKSIFNRSNTSTPMITGTPNSVSEMELKSYSESVSINETPDNATRRSSVRKSELYL